jgi:hypothetical protein
VKVTDEVTHEGLDRVDQTLKSETNKRLEEIRNQQKIDRANKSADKDPERTRRSCFRRPSRLRSQKTD